MFALRTYFLMWQQVIHKDGHPPVYANHDLLSMLNSTVAKFPPMSSIPVKWNETIQIILYVTCYGEVKMLCVFVSLSNLLQILLFYYFDLIFNLFQFNPLTNSIQISSTLFTVTCYPIDHYSR